MPWSSAARSAGSSSSERVEAAGGARVLLEDDRVLGPGLVRDEVLTSGRLLVGRDPLVDRFATEGPYCAEDRTLYVTKPCQQSPSDLMGFEPP
ncbi:hypothetical protein ACFV7Q_15050 [Streptomyces sp. NPDC059851]|uniref:hypothetical protein n=1 Tax=Streptomyces sp. NPDC059851 TaxID=3346971 RepID=UPI0036495E6A